METVETENENLGAVKITVFEFAIIHDCLAETYNTFKKMYEEKDYSRLTEEQLLSGMKNIYSTFFKVDKLIGAYKEDLKKQPEREE